VTKKRLKAGQRTSSKAKKGKGENEKKVLPREENRFGGKRSLYLLYNANIRGEREKKGKGGSGEGKKGKAEHYMGKKTTQVDGTTWITLCG